jgi:hypothetical protein
MGIHEPENRSTGGGDTINEAVRDGHTTDRDNLGDEIDPDAVGGNAADIVDGYYLTPSFLATFIATCMGISCFKLGYVLPVNTLSIINADIGTSYFGLVICEYETNE